LKDAAEKKKQHQQKRELKKAAQLYDTHDFWESQPVPKVHDNVGEEAYNNAIDDPKTVDDIQADPLSIPAGFTWSNVNVADDAEAKEVYDLLT